MNTIHTYFENCTCSECIRMRTESFERDKLGCSAPRGYAFLVEDRYGAPFEQLEPPDGYEFTGEFRPASEPENFLAPKGWATPGAWRLAVSEAPVLILRPRPKRKRIIFEESVDGLWLSDFCTGQVVPAHKPGYRGLRCDRREEEF